MTTPGAKKMRILYLGDPLRPKDPWAEVALDPPKQFEIEFLPLLEIHRYTDSHRYSAISIILLDLDMIAQTKPLDTWSVTAWRSTFNALVTQLTSNLNGSSPKLVGFSRSPTWQIAKLGVQIGARELAPLKELSQTLLDTFGEKTATAPDENKKPASSHTSLRSEATTLLSHSNTLPSNNASLSALDENAPSSDSTILKFQAREAAKPAATNEPELPEYPAEFQSIARHTIPFPVEGLDGTSHAIEGVKDIIRRAAPIDTSIMIVGPTGSGKELVARSIHKHSSRFAKAFITVHCASLNPNLIESELFGHVKGAFTDASQTKTGLLQLAHEGTLFLDEISALSGDVQSRLLRVLSDRKITPVGATESVDFDVRVLSSTQISPADLIEQGRLREDLLFRLRVIEISLPSLIERKADIPVIAQVFLKKLAKKHKRPVLDMTDEAMEKFLLYKWPGNVRELENVLEHASTLSWAEDRLKIELRDLPESVRFTMMSASNDHDLKEAVRRFEKEFISATVRRLGGSKEEAAEILGLSLATLYRKLGS